MSVYLASDVPLPTPDWDEARPGFHVRDVSDTETWLRKGALKPYLYELGSHQGCGCGFHCDEVPLNEECGRARQDLQAYLTLALRDQPEVELFAGWSAGPWSIPTGKLPPEPSKRERFTPEEFTRLRPVFNDDEWLMIVRPGG